MPQATTQKQENRLVMGVLFTFLVSGAGSQPLGSFIPFLRQAYNLDYDFSGMLLSAQSVGNLLAVLLAGVLPVYLGRKRAVLSTAIWMLVCYLLFAMGVSAPLLLLIACVMNGIARGGNSGFCNTMISTLPGKKATRGYNLLHGAFAVGALVSPVLLIVFANRWPNTGWRMMTALLAGLCLAQLVVLSTMKMPTEQPTKSIKTVDRSFLKEKQFWLGCAILFCYISSEYAIVGWLVTYFQDTGVLNPNDSQLMNSLLWLVIFFGRMIGAAITGKVSRAKLLLVDGVGMFVFFLIMFFSRSAGMVVLGLIGVGLFMATIYPTAFAFGSDNIKGNDLGCSIMIFTASIGGIITPALVGFVAKQIDIRAGMGLVAGLTGLLLVTIIASVWLSHREPENQAQG